MGSRVALAAYRDLWLRYLRPQSSAAARMAAFLVASTALQLLAPPVTGRFVDEALAKAPQGDLVRIALLFLLVSLAAQVMHVLATFWSEQVAWEATNALRLDLTAHLLRLDLGFHREHTPGELIERVDGDVSALSRLLSTASVDLLGSALLLLGLVAALWIISRWLGLAFGGFVVAVAAALEIVRRRAVPFSERSRGLSALFFGFVGEVLSATEDIRASRGERFVERRFREILRTWMPVFVRAEVGGYAVWIVALVGFGIADGLAYGFGGRLYLSHALTLGSVYTIVAYAALAARPLGTIRERLQELQGADAGIIRVNELLALCPALADGVDDLPAGALAVELQSVSFRYPDGEREIVERELHTLRDISFRLEPGHSLGVLGRSGSGKTTLARLVVRLVDPQEGTVRVGGIDLHRARLAGLRARVGFITQDVQLFEASLRDNLTLFDDSVPDDGLCALLRSLGLGPWLARLSDGLESVIGPGSLSAGEAQLIACVRAFQMDPGLVILDEASSRLDPASEAMLQRAVDRLIEARTAIVITHRLATLERVDDILVMDGGRIAEFGPRQVLARDPGSLYSLLRRRGFQEVLD